MIPRIRISLWSARGGWSRRGAAPAGLRGRLRGLLATVMGGLLLAAAIISSLTAGRAAELTDLDRGLSSNAAAQTAALKEYFERAQSIDLLLANDSVFDKFNPGKGRLSAARSRDASRETGQVMAYLEKLYPGRISEACFIDAAGTELGRVVRGKIAPTSEMSMAEQGNPFFAPTMAVPEGHVYQAGPYLSPDTHEWVIANSTPKVNASGQPWGMVHFEVSLDSFRPRADSRRGYTALIVDNRNGRILLDSERPLLGGASLGREGSAELRALVTRPGDIASGTADGQRLAVARVPVQQDNANSWSVISSAPIPDLGLSMSITPSSMAMALVALLLLTFGGLSLRSSLRRRVEARYRALIDQSSDVVLVVDRAGRTSFASPAAERLLAPQTSAEDTLTSPHTSAKTGPIDFITAIDPLDRTRFSTALLTASPGRMSAGEFRVTGRDSVSTFEVSVQDLTADPSVGGLVLTGRDVTDRIEMQREIEHRALHDTLTGLPNRALLADRFEQALLRSERSGIGVGLLMLDLDRFKEVNDTFGHHYGDELLRQIGPRLSRVLRGVDTIARLGGDEFAVLLLDVLTVEGATKVAAELLAALTQPFHVEGVDFDVEASIGVVISGDHGQDVISLMQHADIAMYVAKTQNLGVFTYDPTINAHSASKLAMVGALRRALECDELVLHFQPKINVSTGDLVGAEALVRWQHLEAGLIFPDEFIPIAERTGLINPLTRHVLNIALAQARTWMDHGRPLPVAVNLSVRNLHDEHFAELVTNLLVAHGVPADLLELEVTETAIMTDPHRSRQMLEKLSSLGVRLSLDDFGAGNTSLSQLTSMPLSEIKIDRSFVMTMIENADNSLIMQAVISLGHNLGLTIVAEGVETEDALTALASWGCDVAQGYHISRPVPAEAFDAWSAGRRIGPEPAPHVRALAAELIQ